MTVLRENLKLQIQSLEVLQQRFPDAVTKISVDQKAMDMPTVEIDASKIKEIAYFLRDDANFCFDLLLDVCGVDYLAYGLTEWQTKECTSTGYSRGVDRTLPTAEIEFVMPKRFAVVYHLLSVKNNQRLRLRCFIDGEPPVIDSVCDVWSSANWFEREAFDLFGIVFNGHPDLRRILTDYGFVGHPFRKDFPISGNVEVHYDEALKRVVYRPVSVVPRTLVPKVIREDNRYFTDEGTANV